MLVLGLGLGLGLRFVALPGDGVIHFSSSMLITCHGSRPTERTISTISVYVHAGWGVFWRAFSVNFLGLRIMV
jgi:hypothetical protein